MGDPISFGTAFIIGLLGGAHCIGMCGGIINALSFAVPADQRNGAKLNFILLAYNVGRIFSYTLAGVIIGAVGWWLQGVLGPLGMALRFTAGILLIAMGLYLAGWWFGLRYLEQAGGNLWAFIEPLGKRLMPVTGPGQALVLGMVWGWLPCGMVYSVLTWSAGAGDWFTSAMVMLSFGLGTLPVMFVTGRFAHVLKTFVQKTFVRQLAGAIIISFGVWTIVGTLSGQEGHQHAEEHSNMNMSMSMNMKMTEPLNNNTGLNQTHHQ